MKSIGTSKITIVNPKNLERYLVDFTIVSGDFTRLIGLKTAQEIKLLTVQCENILSTEDDTPKQEPSPLDLTKERVMTDYSDAFGE